MSGLHPSAELIYALANGVQLDAPAGNRSALLVVLFALAKRGAPVADLKRIMVAAELDPTRPIRDLLCDYRDLITFVESGGGAP